MAYSIRYIYQIIDKFSPVMNKINKATENFQSGVRNAGKGLKNFGDKASNVKNALAGIGAGAALALTAGKAMDFEDVMTDVRKVVTFNSDKAFEDFREQIFKTSVELGKMPRDIAQIAVAGGKLGVLPEDLNDFIGVVARTSVAFDMLEAEAGDQIGSIQAKLGMTVKETGNLMDAINYLADNTAASGRKMIEVIARTSGNLATIKMPTKFMAGWAAFADQLEVSPELAASGINMMMARMRKVPGMLEKMMKSPHEAIGGFLTQITKMDEIKRSKFIDEVFGPEAGRFILKATANMKLFHKTMKLVEDEGNFTNSMMKELTKKLATAKTAWGQMQATMDVVAITIGDSLLPYIKELAPKVVKMGLAFREWAKVHPEIVKVGLKIAGLVAIIGPVLMIMGLLITSTTAVAGVIGTAFGAFIFAFIGVGLAIYQVYRNWNDLVDEFQRGLRWIGTQLRENLAFQALAIAVVAMGAIAAPILTAIALAVIGIGSAINEVVKNWDYLVDDFKRGFEYMKEKFEGFKNKGKQAMGFFEKLDQKFGLAPNENINKETAGIAAQNTIASQSTLNGNITVEATKGTDVKSTKMKTDVPGNLGFNMAAVGM